MDNKKAKHILIKLDKINDQIDLLGKILVNRALRPIPVHVKVQKNRKFH